MVIQALRSMAALLMIPAMAWGVAPEIPGKYVLEPFNYKGVALNDGPLLRQVLEVRNDYLRVPNDDFLKGFRQRAGRPAPGVDLEGWYKDDIFHVFGQVLSGLARMYAATGDPACKEKLDALVHDWAECIEPDGYFFFSRKPNAPHYIYEKMVCGLVDAHLYAGNSEALGCLDRITTWAEKNLDRKNEYAFNWGGGPTEWYTLSENLYRAYLATGQQRYRDFAKVWEFTDYWNIYANKGDIFSRKDFYHAYSHVNTLSGAAAAYRVTGEQRYLDSIVNAYDYLQAQQTYATGGYGPNEMLLPPDKLLKSLDEMDNHFEVQCGSWAAFKLCKSLICFSGDARYGDWIERLVINGIGASISTSAKGGVDHYARYGLSGTSKDYTLCPWTCCAGGRIQAIADYEDLVFFKSSDALCVNLYTPATVTWDCRGTPVTLRQQTRFPEEPCSQFVVNVSKPVEFALRLRVPGWLASPMTMSINGELQQLQPDDKHWLTIRRTWQNGDRVNVTLPMSFVARRFPTASANPFPCAITYGPVVMAFRSAAGTPATKIRFDSLQAQFSPIPGERLQYHLASDPAVLVRPFYAFKQAEPYYVYLDPGNAWCRLPREQVKFSAGWREGDLRVTKEAGQTVECTFTGVGVRWVGRKYDDAGRTRIELDGKDLGTIDQYDPGRDIPFRHEIRGLTPGSHTLRLTTLEDKNPASKDRYVNLIGIDVLPATPSSQPGSAQ